MPVNKDVMLSAMWSHTKQHYEAFSMNIDLLIPLKKNVQDYLRHPNCDASTVADLVQHGESLVGISRSVGASRYVVKQVLRALNMRPNLQLRPAIDPLHHPKIDLEIVKNLRKQGKTICQIASALHVKKQLLSETMRAAAAAGEHMDPLEPRARPNFPSRVNYSHHSKAKPEVVKQLIAEGYSVTAIAQRVQVSSSTVRKVLVALQAEDPSSIPSATRHTKRIYKLVDYLHHPRCSPIDIKKLQNLGYTQPRMAEKLGVSIGMLLNVLRAMKHDSEGSQPSSPV